MISSSSSSSSSSHSRFPGIAGLEHIRAGRPSDSVMYLPDSLNHPPTLLAASSRALPCLTLIVTCGDEEVYIASRTAAAACARDSTHHRSQEALLQQRFAPLALVRVHTLHSRQSLD
jgi:hypothetical protein